jgi:hypothetical protein
VAQRGGAELAALLAEDVPQPRDVAPSHLRPEEDPVGQARGAAGGALALGPHLERRVWGLVGREAQSPPGDRGVSPLERDLLARPETLHDRERLLELGHAVLPAEPDQLELLLAVADGHAHVETAVAEVVECNYVLGDLDRVEHRQQENRGLQAHPAGLGREPGEHRERLGPYRRVRDEMLADGNPREAHAGGGGHHLHGLVEDAGGPAVGGTPEWREVEPDLHRAGV